MPDSRRRQAEEWDVQAVSLVSLAELDPGCTSDPSRQMELHFGQLLCDEIRGRLRLLLAPPIAFLGSLEHVQSGRFCRELPHSMQAGPLPSLWSWGKASSLQGMALNSSGTHPSSPFLFCAHLNGANLKSVPTPFTSMDNGLAFQNRHFSFSDLQKTRSNVYRS